MRKARRFSRGCKIKAYAVQKNRSAKNKPTCDNVTSASSPAPSSQVNSWLATPGATKEVLKEFGFYTKHHLGQNFLVQDAVIGKILKMAALDLDDYVLEVGPGIGTLTVGLLQHAGAVCSLEMDTKLAPVLAATCGEAQAAGRHTIVWGDALQINHQTLLAASQNLAGFEGQLPGKLVSNLPYQIAATLIMQVFWEMTWINTAVVMVQAEVADRIMARPQTKSYGAYTAKLALCAQVFDRFEVSPSNFMPPPHVKSAVIGLKRRPFVDKTTGKELNYEQIQAVSKLINAAFSMRRKTLQNCLVTSGYAKDKVVHACEVMGIDPQVRAEVLEPAQFVELAYALGCIAG